MWGAYYYRSSVAATVDTSTMSSFIKFLFLLVLVDLAVCQNPFRDDEDVMPPEIYCDHRRDEEFFRKQLPLNASESEYDYECKFYYRCVPAAFSRRSISKNTCPHTLFFDVEAQTCKHRRDVLNCHQWEKNRIALPRWPLQRDEVSNCPDPDGEIECGSGECLPKALFCDSHFDCTDESDENICKLGLDPNSAEACSPSLCEETRDLYNETTIYSTCYCSPGGNIIPGNLALDEVPQMILVTFNGAVTERSFRIYDDLFQNSLINSGSGCSVKATFFVTHLYSNYSAIQELHRRGHEISVYSVTNEINGSYWETLDQYDYDAEFEGMRLLVETFSDITDGSIAGMRVPNERVGGNEQFRMMQDRKFLYDASVVVPSLREPLWPYTLDYSIPHKCPAQNCPSKSFPAIWEVPINTLDRREDTRLDERLTGCSYIDACAVTTPDYLVNVLNNNLNRHRATNRAPLVISFTAGYFDSRKDLRDAFKKWMQDTVKDNSNNFVTIQQALKWMVTPKKVSEIGNFKGWQDNCEVTGQPLCSRPNACPLKPRVREITDETVFLNTCQRCPDEYPWLDNLDFVFSSYYK